MTATDENVRNTTDGELLEHFRPVFEEIARGAGEREKARKLPFDAVERLRAAGYGRIRIPREYGGFGASIEQYARLQIELGAADSNLPQVLRGHFGFLETRLRLPDESVREFWFGKVVGGALIGNAQSEQTNPNRTELGATLTRGTDGRLRLNGTKYYSTGSIFADWLVVTATQEDGTLGTAAVEATSPGVDRIDDWDGFGQRLTGSGTTVFTDVLVDESGVEPGLGAIAGESYLIAFYQLTLLAALAGVARAAVKDTVDFVGARKRHLQSPVYDLPREDPAIQQIVGEIAGAATTAEASVVAAARAVDHAASALSAGTVTTADIDASDYAVFHIQATVIDLVLKLTSRLFEVGGASAVSTGLQLDRHWRNARTIASHNPAVFRDQIAGDYLLNGTRPSQVWEKFYRG